MLAALERHGLSAAAAQALWRWGVALRDQTLRTKREYGAFVDAESGELFGDVLGGTGDEFEAGSLLRALRPDRRYATVHTHPEGGSFSPVDAAVLVAHAPLLRVVAAVGAQGNWYMLSVAPGGVPPDPVEIRPAYRLAFGLLAPTYSALVQEGALTRRVAQRAHTHAVWERLAPTMGLRYDRV